MARFADPQRVVRHLGQVVEVRDTWRRESYLTASSRDFVNMLSVVMEHSSDFASLKVVIDQSTRGTWFNFSTVHHRGQFVDLPLLIIVYLVHNNTN